MIVCTSFFRETYDWRPETPRKKISQFRKFSSGIRRPAVDDEEFTPKVGRGGGKEFFDHYTKMSIETCRAIEARIGA